MTGDHLMIAALACALGGVAGAGCGSDADDGGMTDVAAAGVGGGGALAGAAGGMTAGIGVGPLSGAGGTGAMSAGAGGSAPGGANAAGGGGVAPTETPCTITASVTMSPVISTVGIVEFTTDLPGIDSAYVEFGLDASYGMTAPVDLREPGYRTVLIGMKAQRDYHYRVVVSSASQRCTGPDATLQTGDLPNRPRLITVDVETPQPEKVSKGFVLSGFLMGGPAFIVDSDGDYVWWYDTGGITRARMSYDGKYIWTQALNWSTGLGPVPAGTNPGGHPSIHRISLDGMDVQEYGIDEIGDATHDFDVTPDGSYILPDLNSLNGNGCTMKVVERTAEGQHRDVIGVAETAQSDECLINAIHYWPGDGTITYSDLPNNSIVKVTRSGEVLWILGGVHSTFTQGDAIGWIGGQHGHHVLSPDRVLLFNNGTNPYTGGRDGTVSMAYEIELDQATQTATRVWEYDGGQQTYAFGDVQRLANGNTIVNYGVKGTLHEVDPDGNLVQSMSWALGGVVPYIDWRASLYGPPDR